MSTKAQVDLDVEHALGAVARRKAIPSFHRKYDVAMVLEAQAQEAERCAWKYCADVSTSRSWCLQRATELRRKAKELSA